MHRQLLILMGRVLDINMKMPERLQGFVEAQGDLGKNAEEIAAANIFLNIFI